MGNSSRSHHLLKHSLPEVDVLHHFGSIEPKEVSREINKLGQRDLQAKFRAVYGTQTYSNNNCWLRRKLMEAAGLQTPKASSRGRPAVKQGRAPSPGSVSHSEGPSMSRSGSIASQQASDRPSVPECNVIRRTKRPHKPKQYEDMLISAQLPGHQAASDDDDDCRPAKISATESEVSYRADILQGQGHGTELVWSKSATHSFTASHLITPSTSWTGTLAPSTPEKLAFRAALPALLATGQGSAASKLLGSREVLGDYHSNLPAWADLPSNERASSQDLDAVSFQVPEMHAAGSNIAPAIVPSAATVAAAAEVLIAPPTPERLMAAACPSAAHLLHDMPAMPIMSSLLTKPTAPPKVPGMVFDFFTSPPPTVTSPDLLPTAPAEFERRTEFPMVSSANLSDSSGSEISELDVLLEGISSNQMTHEFDEWLKDMPCPDLGPCEL